MNIKYQYDPVYINDHSDFIKNKLNGYFKHDVWDLSSPHIKKYGFNKYKKTRTVDFNCFAEPIKSEIKIFFSYLLKTNSLSENTIINYFSEFQIVSFFFKDCFTNSQSVIATTFDEFEKKWVSFAVKNGIKIYKKGKLKSNSTYFLCRLYRFIDENYDVREEFEKDYWDVHKIPGATYSSSKYLYRLNFTQIPQPYKNLVKRYLKFRISTVGFNSCSADIKACKRFFNFIHKKYPTWRNLNNLSREDIESFFEWNITSFKKTKYGHRLTIVHLYNFIEYILKIQCHEAPTSPLSLLIFKEDIPKQSVYSENEIKYIPEEILQQLEEHIEKITPPKYIPIFLLLRATGWRISDILNLKYNTCLEQTQAGWYLCGDITKTQVNNHRIPISIEIATLVNATIEEAKTSSTPDNNPDKFLFACYKGRRRGKPFSAVHCQRLLNKLSKKHKITDKQGHIFHFKNHAFRHTKGIELINNGMNILHVQKWMAHASPEMTIRYAKILDETMYQSWKEIEKKGIFKYDKKGSLIRTDFSEIEDEDLIEWEYIRHNLEAVSMPLGYCFKPKKIDCKTQLTPCLTCQSFCTTPDFIPQFEIEIDESKKLIERGKQQGRILWVEKNQALIDRLENVVSILTKGKTYHKAGKPGREYIGEQRNAINSQTKH
jgi:integrase